MRIVTDQSCYARKGLFSRAPEPLGGGFTAAAKTRRKKASNFRAAFATRSEAALISKEGCVSEERPREVCSTHARLGGIVFAAAACSF